MYKVIIMVAILFTVACGILEKTYSVYFEKNPKINSISKIYSEKEEIGKVISIDQKNEFYVAKISINDKHDRYMLTDKCFYVEDGDLYMKKIDQKNPEKLTSRSKIIGFNSYIEFISFEMKQKGEKLKKTLDNLWE